MIVFRLIKTFVLYLTLFLIMNTASFAADLENGEEITSGCPNANCECINDSSRGVKEVIEEDSEGDSSSSGRST